MSTAYLAVSKLTMIKPQNQLGWKRLRNRAQPITPVWITLMIIPDLKNSGHPQKASENHRDWRICIYLIIFSLASYQNKEEKHAKDKGKQLQLPTLPWRLRRLYRLRSMNKNCSWSNQTTKCRKHKPDYHTKECESGQESLTDLFPQQFPGMQHCIISIP